MYLQYSGNVFLMQHQFIDHTHVQALGSAKGHKPGHCILIQM